MCKFIRNLVKFTLGDNVDCDLLELEDGARGATAAPTPYLTQSPDEPSAALQKQQEEWRADLARVNIF